MENIEDLGLYLKTIREERKIPIAQIAQEFKTKLEFVQAIESNDFGKFPAPTYVKGFIRSYAKYLDLDPDQIIAIYNKYYLKEAEQVIILEGKKVPHIGLKINKSKLILWIFITLIAILIITFGSIWIFHSLKTKDITKPVKPTPAKPAPEKITPLALNTPISTPITLAAQTKDTVWMRVYADRKLIFEGILAKDENKKWQAKTEFKLRIGNPGVLNLTLNGKPLGEIAPYGPVNVVINEKGVTVEK